MPRNRMEKQTKKMVTIGVTVFAAVSLFSIAAAGFVVTSSASASVGGNAHLGIIRDTQVRFETGDGKPLSDFYQSDDQDNLYNRICFDAPKDDNFGRFRYLDDGSGLSEHLTVRVKGKALPVTYISRVTLQMSCSTEYSGYNGDPLKDAIEAGYLELKPLESGKTADYLSQAVEIPLGTYDSADDSKAFDLEVGFQWGEAFNYENPSIYFDDTNPKGGASISDDEMKQTMREFNTLLHYGPGYRGEYPKDENLLPKLSFTVTLVAEIN